MQKYDHTEVEKKWQKRWEESGANIVTEDRKKKKSYLLIEFPYPSGEGLHVGHVRSWTALDIVARKRRAEGYNVLYPIGWDAFGLPAENYAVKTGIHPRITTKQNTDTFRRQIKAMGISFDWSREIDTTDPKYYRWTQWIFLQLFKKGLAYKAKMPINWCLSCKIGLANEEVIDGRCERCGGETEKREKEQWMLAITKYADRLDRDLDTVDYWERIKIQQRNWIGRSEGTEIDFQLTTDNKQPLTEKITVFTTRPDTLFGATYMVLAPEHALVQKLKDKIQNWDEVIRYIVQTQKKTEIERTTEGKEKTGVELKGVRAINPVSKEEIPIFIADYVLAHYGTGAIMAVPAHDERDFVFAKKFGLPIKEVIQPLAINNSGQDALRVGEPLVERRAAMGIVKHWKEDSYLVLDWKQRPLHALVTGGIDEGEEPANAFIREVREETGYKHVRLVRALGTVHSQFYHVEKKQNRFAHLETFLIELEDDEREEPSAQEQSIHTSVWITKDAMMNYLDREDFKITWSRVLKEGAYSGSGIMTNSGQFDGLSSGEAKKKITEAVEGEWKTVYKLRDWVFSRQRYWGEPIPLVYCEKDGWTAVSERELPVLLPNVEAFKPTDTGESPLASATEWINTTCPTCGGPAKRETDTMPNWAGSSWYYLRYMDPHNTETFVGKDELAYWSPVDWYNGGMEHTTLHLLYSRFWHKFLFDEGLVPTNEPYAKRTSHGLILAKGGEKMSKSKGNVVSPDAIVEQFGADTLRVGEMFMGPFDQPVVWSTGVLAATRRFLDRVWKMQEKLIADNKQPRAEGALETLIHQSIKKISADIENLKMNTAISQLMILLNALEQSSYVARETFRMYVRLLAPFAPHVAEELWERSGGAMSVHLAPWPRFDESKIASSSLTIAVQVNGKLRATVEVSADASDSVIEEMAKGSPTVKKWLGAGEISRTVHVRGRLINFIVNP